MDKRLHDNFYRPFVTNKKFIERFEQTIKVLLAKTIGCSPYTLFCLELEKFCVERDFKPPTTTQRQEIFCAIAEWCFVGLSISIEGLCQRELSWEFWEKIGRRLKAGDHTPGDFFQTERIIPSTDTAITLMDSHTHDQFYLAIINDSHAYAEVQARVTHGNSLDVWLSRYCTRLARLHNLEHLDTSQRMKLAQALTDLFRVNYNTPSNRYPAPTKEEPAMINNTPAFQTKHFVDGVDATTLSDDQLINTIKRLEAEIKALGEIKSSSKKITAKVTELDVQRSAVVDLLDARMP